MAIYTGNQSLLNAALGEYQGMGFALIPNGRIHAILYFKDRRITTYNLDDLNISKLRKECRKFLSNTGEGLYPFVIKGEVNGDVTYIPAPDAELATLRAWDYLMRVSRSAEAPTHHTDTLLPIPRMK